MGNYLKKPIIDEAVQSGRLGTINYASNTIQVSDIEFGVDLEMDGSHPTESGEFLAPRSQGNLWSNLTTSEKGGFH